MSEVIPLFPLNIVVFPEEKLSLHIFEPRYKQLLQDCKESNSVFGMPFFHQDKIAEYGTLLKLLSTDGNYPGGEIDIKTRGCGTFRIKQFYPRLPGKHYAGAHIEIVNNIMDEEVVTKTELLHLLQKYYRALRLDNLLIKPHSIQAFNLGHHVGLSVQQEYQLLQLRKESERQEFLMQHLQKVVPELEETEKLKDRIRLN